MQDNIIPIAKAGTLTSLSATIVSDLLASPRLVSWLGLAVTIFFAVLGLFATVYFKRREEKIQLAEFRQKFPDSELPL